MGRVKEVDANDDCGQSDGARTLDIGSDYEYGVGEDLKHALCDWLFCSNLEESLDRQEVLQEWTRLDDPTAQSLADRLQSAEGGRTVGRLLRALTRHELAPISGEEDLRLMYLAERWCSLALSDEELIGHLILSHDAVRDLPAFRRRCSATQREVRELYRLHRVAHTPHD